MADDSSDASKEAPSIRIARMIQEQSESHYIAQHGEILATGSSYEKRRVRREARLTGKDAYIGALERFVQSTQAEKDTLVELLEQYKNHREDLIEQLRIHGFNYGS